MLVDATLADVRPPYRQEIPFEQPDPDNPVLDPETGAPKTTDFIQHPRSIERWPDARLAAMGLYRLNDDPRPGGLVTAVERREFRTVDGVRQAWRAWDTAPLPASAPMVDAEREVRLAAAAPVTLAKGSDGGDRTFALQTRNETDLVNITGRESKAQLLKARGEAGPIRVRDADNVIHELTPDEMIDVAEQIHDHREALYFAGFAVKARIEDGTLTDATEIAAAFDAALAALAAPADT